MQKSGQQPGQRPRLSAIAGYSCALALGIVAVLPYVELRGRFILEPDMPLGDIQLYYDTWRSGAWRALPAPGANVYFEGHSLIYGLILSLWRLVHGPFAAPFDEVAAAGVSVVNAIAHAAATLVMFATLRRLAAHTGLALALAALFAFAPQILDIDLVRIDRLMLLPLVVILDISLRIAQGQATMRQGLILGAATAVIAATKISGIVFVAFPATAFVIAAVLNRKNAAVLRRLADVSVRALVLGVPVLALLMIRFILHPADFIGDVKAGAAAQLTWTAIFPFTPRLYYNVDLFAGYGPAFLVLAAAAMAVVVFVAAARKDPQAIWLIVNLALFSTLGVIAFKYSRGGYHLVPLYLYAMAVAARVAVDAFPHRIGGYVRTAGALLLLALLLPLGRTAVTFSHSAAVARQRPASIAASRFVARNWIATHFPAGARICMMGSSQWAGPRLKGLGYHVTTQVFDFPYLSRATMADFIAPRLDQLHAACDAIVFNDLHKAAYVDNFRTFDLGERFAEWQQMFQDLARAYPPAVFAAQTPAYYVTSVEVYDLRGTPQSGDTGPPFLRPILRGAVTDGNILMGGTLVPVDTDSVTGAVDSAARYGDKLAVQGWATTADHRQPATGVMIAVDDAIIGVDGTGTSRRSDVASAFNAPQAEAAGFSTCVSVPSVAKGHELKVFAVSAAGKTSLIGGGGIVIKDAPAGAPAPSACSSAEGG